MKKSLSVLLMVFAVAFGVLVFNGTTSKAATWDADIRQTDASDSSAKLEWNAYLGADFYEIYFSNDNSSWTEMDWSSEPSATIYNLTSGQTYYVKVVAYTGYHWDDNATPVAESLSTDVVTAPGEVKNLVQTSATTSSISMKWNAVSGASGYMVYRYNSWDNYTRVGVTSNTSYTVNGLAASTKASYVVCAYRSNSAKAAASGRDSDIVTMKTVPAKVAYVAITNYYDSISVCYYGWNGVNNADGYQFQLLNNKGKSILTSDTTGTSVRLDPYKKGIFTKARCRAYVIINNKKIYGAWSGYNYNASCKKIVASRSRNRKKITIKWSKITGASGYQVYVSTSQKGKYKKLKTLSAKKTSYSFTKIGKKKISKSKTYYIRLKYLTKVGKKNVASKISGQGSI